MELNENNRYKEPTKEELDRNKELFVQSLLDRGYKQWNSYETNIELYQKRFEDSVGIKYHIDCRILELSRGHFYIKCATFSVQLQTRWGSVELETVQWFNGLTLENTIDDVEVYFESFWEFNGRPYYEKNEDNG